MFNLQPLRHISRTLTIDGHETAEIHVGTDYDGPTEFFSFEDANLSTQDYDRLMASFGDEMVINIAFGRDARFVMGISHPAQSAEMRRARHALEAGDFDAAFMNAVDLDANSYVVRISEVPPRIARKLRKHQSPSTQQTS